MCRRVIDDVRDQRMFFVSLEALRMRLEEDDDLFMKVKAKVELSAMLRNMSDGIWMTYLEVLQNRLINVGQ